MKLSGYTLSRYLRYFSFDSCIIVMKYKLENMILYIYVLTKIFSHGWNHSSSDGPTVVYFSNNAFMVCRTSWKITVHGFHI